MFVLPFNLCSTQSLLDDGVFVHSKSRIHANESNEIAKKRIDLNVSELGKKRFTVSEKIRYNPFLDIQCDYIKPGDLHHVLSKEQEKNLSLFHSNIRSVNKNFDSYLGVFRKCDKLSDIMALSETKLSDTSVQPELPGYKFESVNSPTQADGVVLYISNNFDYRKI